MSSYHCITCGYVAIRATDCCDNPACIGNPTLSDSHRAKLVANAAAYKARCKADRERREFRERLRAAGFHPGF